MISWSDVVQWSALAFAVALVLWSVARMLREPPPSAVPASAASRDGARATSSVTKDEKKAERASAPPPPPERTAEAIPPPPVLPNLSEEDEDLEVTMVTASPLLNGPTDDGDSDDDSDSDASEPPPNEASKVEVIYEDEADVEEITSPVARILVSASGQSDRGLLRRNNEDSLLGLPERSLFAIADGMGGYKGGEVASALAVETLRTAFEQNTFDGVTESKVTVPRRGLEMAQAIQMANHAIFTRAKGDAELKQMGTTIVAARFSPNKQRAYIGHVGDSRCYRIRGTTMRQLTTDHTLGHLGVKGPGSEHLYQAVGIKPKITIDLIVDKPRVEDIYLLCSDGLSKMATDDEIRDVVLQEPDLDAAVYSLIELAKAHGGKDNVTVVMIKIVERAPTQPPPQVAPSRR